MACSKEKPVELGFAQEQKDAWKLSSAAFASKLGGRPAWLNLKDLPSPTRLCCPACSGPTKFLLQIYAPVDSPVGFHRSVFLFLCPSQGCWGPGKKALPLLALRSQLQRKNPFYPPDPPLYTAELAKVIPQKFGAKVCRVCGAGADQHCASCGKINYCSKQHQTLDWGQGHKQECSNPDFKPEDAEVPSSFNYKEYEIVIDTEVIPKEKPGKKQADELKEFEKLVTEGKAGSLTAAEVTKDMLEASSYKSDKIFNKFRKRVAYEPEQILRYDLGGEPLWVSPDNTPEKKDIPPCPRCKGKRVFEFQVMPQLLNYLGKDSVEGSVDWGTIAIYTCEANCNPDDQVEYEFVWKQDYKPDEIDK